MSKNIASIKIRIVFTMKDSSFWDVTVPRAMSLYANLIFAVLWIGFVIALIVDRAWLDLLWNWAPFAR